MIKCPFCQFDNEDGVLFCEQCKSELSGVEPLPPAAQAVAAQPAEAPAAPEGAIPLAADGVTEAKLVDTVPMEGVPLAALADLEPTIPMGASVAGASPATTAPEAAAAPPVASAPVTPAEAPAVAPASPAPDLLPPGVEPKLKVLRGQKRNVEYPIYEGLNFIGRADEKPVDIDLEDQEPPDRVWCSRQHALITFEEGKLFIEDLNSANGTYVNRSRIYPGQKRPLLINDVIQIGNVQIKVIL
jgi:hypothetical protein